METQNSVTGTISKFFPYDENTNRGGFGFVESNKKEYFFNVKYCKIPPDKIAPGVKVSFYLRKGFDKKKNQKTEQATEIHYA